MGEEPVVVHEGLRPGGNQGQRVTVQGDRLPVAAVVMYEDGTVDIPLPMIRKTGADPHPIADGLLFFPDLSGGLHKACRADCGTEKQTASLDGLFVTILNAVTHEFKELNRKPV